MTSSRCCAGGAEAAFTRLIWTSPVVEIMNQARCVWSLADMLTPFGVFVPSSVTRRSSRAVASLSRTRTTSASAVMPSSAETWTRTRCPRRMASRRSVRLPDNGCPLLSCAYTSRQHMSANQSIFSSRSDDVAWAKSSILLVVVRMWPEGVICWLTQNDSGCRNSHRFSEQFRRSTASTVCPNTHLLQASHTICRGMTSVCFRSATTPCTGYPLATRPRSLSESCSAMLVIEWYFTYQRAPVNVTPIASDMPVPTYLRSSSKCPEVHTIASAQ